MQNEIDVELIESNKLKAKLKKKEKEIKVLNEIISMYTEIIREFNIVLDKVNL